jgi:hypothetical protein
VHLGLEAGDVAVAEVLAELVDLLQLQKVDPQHLDGLHHLGRERERRGIYASSMIREGRTLHASLNVSLDWLNFS